MHADRQMIYEIILEDGKFKSLARRCAKVIYLCHSMMQKPLKILSEFMRWTLSGNGWIISL